MDTTMKPTTAILERIRQNSGKNQDEVFTRLFRYLLRPDLYYLAYKNLYANQGAATKGIDNDTADGFSGQKIKRIIQSLADGTYTPSPARRTYIPKRNGKTRPLGIPTFTDKLVQEVLRMVLEAVYEPVFCDTSHGFRPERSCHTALMRVRNHFTGVRWFIEGDIKGFFDNIDHRVLINLVGKKVKDARLMQVLHKFLKAGYLEDWRYHRTLSGTPQGGIISPLLANIYLHELDKYVQTLKESFDKPRAQNFTPEYTDVNNKMMLLSYHLKRAQDPELIRTLVARKKELRAQKLRLPAKSQTDKRLVYVRYADDFLIGINGNRVECEQIKGKIKAFLANMRLEMSDEKTLITHSSEYARFLGYDIRVRRNNQIQQGGCGCTKRKLSNKVELNIPLTDRIERFLFDKQAVRQENGKLWPVERRALVRSSDLEILTVYNAELRGICNYYGMASNFYRLNYFAYLMEYSCLKTLAAKHKSKISKIKERFKDGKGGWCIPYECKSRTQYMYFARYQDSKKAKSVEDLIPNPGMRYVYSRNTFESRLNAKVCEFCGCTNSAHYEIHHVKKLKDLQGKALWEQIMIGRRRKTMVVCRSCHYKIHSGRV